MKNHTHRGMRERSGEKPRMRETGGRGSARATFAMAASATAASAKTASAQTTSTKGAIRAMLAGAAILLVSLLAAGCGGSSTPSTNASSSSGTTEVSAAKAIVASLEKPTTSFKAPGPAIDAKSLAGKSVWYIPISISVPVFAIGNESLQAALSKVGVHLHTCSGNADPSATATCIEHAVASKAAGIIVDAIPVALAPNAFASAQSRHVPVLIVDQLPPPASAPGAVKGHGDDKLAYTLEQDTELVRAEADFTIADAGGQTNVLTMPFTDSPSTLAWGAAAVSELHKRCPECELTSQKVGLANISLVPSQTSSALLSHPEVKYVLPEFDAVLQGVEQGVQQAGYSTKVKVVTAAGDLQGLQMVKAGRLAADVGQDFPYEGWADADEILRMMLGEPIVEEHVPIRMFDGKDVSSLKLTTAAEESGQWYGSDAYKKMFEGLWGVR